MHRSPSRNLGTGAALRKNQTLLKAWTILVLLFLYAPIAVMVLYSFNDSRLNLRWKGFTLHWYEELWADGPLMRALGNSLIVAFSTMIVAVILGTVGAWLLHRYRFRGAAWMHALIAVPIAMPEILMGVSLLVFFAFLNFGLGFRTVIIAHVTFCFPFVLVSVQSRLSGLDPALEEAALDLGATPLRAFLLVIVPALKPAIVAGALLAFTLSLDELIVTFFTAGPNSPTLPLRIFGLARVGLNPKVNALSAVLVFVTAVSVFAANYLRRSTRFGSLEVSS